jgi:predicted MFS family arabinose efflux permease
MILVITAALFYFIHEGTSFWYTFTALTTLGLAYGIIFTITTIGSQQLVEANQKGISTSLQLFARNIGTAVSVTIMGAILTKSSVFYTGIHGMFVFGLLASLLSLAMPFAIRSVSNLKSQKTE